MHSKQGSAAASAILDRYAISALQMVQLTMLLSVVGSAGARAIPISCPEQPGPLRIHAARVDATGRGPGPLLVMLGQTECEIDATSLRSWIIRQGRQLVYSTPAGAGGFENEGQSLRLYDVRSGKRKELLREYYAIEAVREVTTATGRVALIVEMRDGGLGASHVAVVDPRRGEVFIADKAKVVRADGRHLVVGFYRDPDWEVLANGGEATPYRTQTRRLEQLLDSKLVKRKPQPPAGVQ